MPQPAMVEALSSSLNRILGEVPDRFALAVSGGADSMALLHLAHEAYADRCTVLTVDHQLRPEAAAEASYVAKACEALSIPHQTLVWTEGSSQHLSSGNLQAQARTARYDLMTAWCRTNQINVLITAHHGTDQAETVLLNLARGSGVDGLAAMPEVRLWSGVRLVRPLLAYSKRDLEEVCRAGGIDWVTDPSNEDEGFDRIRLRKASDRLEGLGLSARVLNYTASHMARAKQALDFYAEQYLGSWAKLDRAGGVSLTLAPFMETPIEIQLRVLGRVLCAAGGRPHRPEAAQLDTLIERLQSNSMGKITLGGAIVSWEDGRVMVRREARYLPVDQDVRLGTAVFWDQRARWQINEPQPALVLKGLDPSHWSDVCPADLEFVFPADLRPTLPAAYDAEGPVAVPVLGYWRDPVTQAQIACDWAPLQQRLGLWATT